MESNKETETLLDQVSENFEGVSSGQSKTSEVNDLTVQSKNPEHEENSNTIEHNDSMDLPSQNSMENESATANDNVSEEATCFDGNSNVEDTVNVANSGIGNNGTESLENVKSSKVDSINTESISDDIENTSVETTNDTPAVEDKSKDILNSVKINPKVIGEGSGLDRDNAESTSTDVEAEITRDTQAPCDKNNTEKKNVDSVCGNINPDTEVDEENPKPSSVTQDGKTNSGIVSRDNSVVQDIRAKDVNKERTEEITLDIKVSQENSEIRSTKADDKDNPESMSAAPEIANKTNDSTSNTMNNKECSERTEISQVNTEAMELDLGENPEPMDTDLEVDLEKAKDQDNMCVKDSKESTKAGSIENSNIRHLESNDADVENKNKIVKANKKIQNDVKNITTKESGELEVITAGKEKSANPDCKDSDTLKGKLNTEIQDTDPIVLYEVTKDSKRRAREIAGEFQMELALVEIASRIAAMKDQYHLEDLSKDQKRVADCGQCKVSKPLLYRAPDIKYQNNIVCSLHCGMKMKLASLARNSIDLRRRLCPMCNILVTPGEENFSWKTKMYCSSRCLSRHIRQAGDMCGQCNTIIDLPIAGTYCLLRGKMMKLFCSASCRALHKMKTSYCAICYAPHDKADQYAMIEGKYSLCSEQCKKEADSHQKISEPVKCEVCKVVKQPQYHLMMKQGLKYLCSEKCFKAFTFVGHYDMVQCRVCDYSFDKLQQKGTVLSFINEIDYNFCSRFCHFLFLKENVIKKRCNWCRLEKTGTSMVRRILGGGMECFYCNPHCLHMLSGQKIERLKAQKCDVCQTFSQEQYHVPIYSSTATFCSLKCVHIYHNSVLNGNPVIPVEESSDQNEEESLEPLEPDVPKTCDQESQAEPINTVSVMTNTIRQLLIKPDEKKTMRNIATGVVPVMKSKRVSCRTLSICTEAQTGDELEQPMAVPVPMPLYVPIPAVCESFPFPVPVPVPIPVPIPVFIPTHRNSVAGILKEIKKIREEIPENPLEAEILMLAKALPSDEREDSPPPKAEPPLARTNISTNISGNNTNTSNVTPVERVTVERVEVAPVPVPSVAAPQVAPQVPAPAPAPPPAPAPEANSSFDIVQMAISMACSDYETPSHGVQYTELQQASQPASITPMNTAIESNQGVIVSQEMMKPNSANKRSYNSNDSGATSVKQVRQSSSTYNTESSQVAPFSSYQPAVFGLDKPDANMYLKYTLGVNAWRQWAVGKNLELSRAAYAGGNRTITPKLFKPDILQLTQDELVLSLCLFVKEARRPDGTPFSPDVIYYFCLGIQQYLFESGWRGNIFTDPQFETFTCLLDEVCASYHVLHHNISQVEEEHLWESKQLGAHNPHVLLHTLLYFNTKHFLLTSVEEHSHLLFGQIMEHKTVVGGAKGPRNQVADVFLRYSPKSADGREKHVLIQKENKADRLRCPVKLYEFYLTKCPLNVNRHDGRFYLMPEKSCRFDSPVWFSNTPLGEDSIRKMLNRIKIIKEISMSPHTSGMPLNYR